MATHFDDAPCSQNDTGEEEEAEFFNRAVRSVRVKEEEAKCCGGVSGNITCLGLFHVKHRSFLFAWE